MPKAAALTQPSQDASFRSKIDAWIGLVGVAAAVVSIGAIVHIALTQSVPLAMAVAPLLLVGVLPLWLMSSTAYVLSDTELTVRCGPLDWRVPLADIRGITPTRNPLGSPAMSLDRLRIDYQQWRSIMISPSDKARFLEEIEARRSRLAKPRRLQVT